MNKKHHINVDFKNAEAKVKANIVLISFKEQDNFIIYSPHLEVTGYGKTEEEAIQSFNHCLGVFLDYTVNKKTLHKELISLGWQLKKGSIKKPLKVNAPSMSDLLKHNTALEELLNKQDIRTMQKEVAIPV
ncbi:hypothetical protein ACMDB5_13225 [Flavobacterium sp. W1B]|uniref:hypothetical protein n=1 Tax=Flavobacterium sp. W1B TaxID=3394146 RepID=UPI0039BC4D9F